MKRNSALILIGSPKPGKSTSASLGNYLAGQLEKLGMKTETLIIHKQIKSDEGIAGMMESINRFRLLVFVFPLYVDSLPYPVTRAFELISDHSALMESTIKHEMMAVVNCGFPESDHCSVALGMCKQFAQATKMKLLGALSLGEGGLIHGKPLNELGGKVKNVKRALELSAEACAKGESLPDEAKELMAKYMVPRWIYTSVGTMGWKRAAKKNGVKKRLYDRPYGRCQ